MIRKSLLTGTIIAICIFLSFSAYGVLNLEYKDYIVKRGDTLWDISAAELQDPFLWPNIWKENPDIENPDLIYPDQFIKIPVYLTQKQVKMAPPTEETPPTDVSLAKEIPETTPEIEEVKPWKKKEYVVDKNLVMVSGYISPDIPSIGIVKEAPTRRSIVGKNDEIYIDIEGDKTPGRKFYTFRQPLKWRKVKHPNGGTVGYLITITGVGEIVGEESGNLKAVIRESFLDINADDDNGDYIHEYFEVEPPLKTNNPRMPDIKGVIVMTRDARELNAEGDVVYIDKGSKDGVLSGDVFRIISEDYPHIELGKIVVIFTKDETSTAWVTKSEKEIEKGDYF
jgi:hypothetical protein